MTKALAPLLLLTSCSFAQSEPSPFASNAAFSLTPQQIRAAADAVPVATDTEAHLLWNDRAFTIDAQSRLHHRVYTVFRVNTASGVRDWDSIQVHWEPWHEEMPEVRARVIAPDGSVHELDRNTVVDAAVHQGEEYNDSHMVRAPLPAVEAGSIVEEQIVVRERVSLFPSGRVRRVWFNSQVPVQHARLILEAPASVPVRYFASKSLGTVTPAIAEADGTRTLTFVFGPRGPFKDESSYMPFEMADEPYISFSTGANWQAVARGYTEIVERQLHNGDLTGIVKRATAGKTGRDEIATAVLAEVHEQVRYVAVELEDAAIVPREPRETLRRKYGDCKDQATLLVAMLRTASIAAHVALLSSGNDHDLDETQPGFGDFNHAIVWIEGAPGLFVDPTSEFSRFGELPIADQGRMALIARPETTGLTTIPEAPSSSNRTLETREVFLAEAGKSRIVETTQSWGGIEGRDREYYRSTEAEDARKSLTQYMKTNYVSDDAPKIEVGDPSDLSKPFHLKLEIGNASRGFTDSATAVVGVPLGDLLEKLPRIFLDTPKNDDKPRQEDFLLPEAFVAEWRYRVKVPPGFRPAALPPSEEQKIGPALLTSGFATEPDGVVAATFRFDTVKRRLSPAEFESMRKAVREIRSKPVLLLHFEQIGQALLAGGDIKGAIAEYRTLVQLHPKEALHHAQIARALLAAGAGRAARAEARSATELDPKSAEAFEALGWISQHDTIGRRFKGDCDLAGAEKAYRKVKEIDPTNYNARADLAILLEYMPGAVRYGSKGKLAEAIDEYKAIEDKLTDNLQYNLHYALFWAGKYAELKERAASDHTPAGDKFYLAAIAALSGASAALEEANRRVATAPARQTALSAVAQLLINVGFYQQTADMLEALAPAATGAPQTRAMIAALRGAARFLEALKGPSTPELALKHAMCVLLASDTASPVPFFSKALSSKASDLTQEMRVGFAPSRAQLEKAGFPARAATELSMGILSFVIEGDDATGYRITTEVGNQKILVYMTKEDGAYVIRAIGSAALGEEALARIGKDDLAGAKRWLDWARLDVQLGGGEDPLSGSAFPRLWNRNNPPDRAKMEVAAAALADNTSDNEKVAGLFLRAREKAVTDTERLNLDLALLEVYAGLQKGEELLALTQRLMVQYPDSETALSHHLDALRMLKRFAEAGRMVDERIARDPSEVYLYQLGAGLATEEGNLARAEELEKKLIAMGKGGATVLNSLAWDYLVRGKNLDEALDLSRRSVIPTGGFGAMHTLASIYAETGKTAEARQVMLQAMDASALNEPNESCWYVFGRIAEQFGLTEVARDYYLRLKHPKTDRLLGITTYSLAQRRLAAMK